MIEAEDPDLHLESEQDRLDGVRRELASTGEQLRQAVDAVLGGQLPGEVLVQGMRAQDPLPAGRNLEMQPLPTGASFAWLGPPAATSVILYCHGGGGVSGSVAGHRERMEKLGKLCGSRVFALEYRLAPEDPFPSDIEDAVAGYRLLLAEGKTPDRIAFAGDSHGAGVALAALLRLRDESEPMPAAAFLACGVFDRTVVVEEGFLEREVTWDLNDPVLSYGPFLRWLSETYLAGQDLGHALASPLHADLEGLPPLFIQAGEMEVLRGQSEKLARAVRQAGGEATLDLVAQMFHNFHAYPLQAARAAVRRAAGFLEEKLEHT